MELKKKKKMKRHGGGREVGVTVGERGGQDARLVTDSLDLLTYLPDLRRHSIRRKQGNYGTWKRRKRRNGRRPEEADLDGAVIGA